MEKFESKVMTSWWQYAVRPCFKILVTVAILVSVALIYNFEWHTESGIQKFKNTNWKAIAVLKPAPKIAHYKDVATLEKSSTVGW